MNIYGNDEFQERIEKKLTEIYHDFIVTQKPEEAQAVECGLFSVKAWGAVMQKLSYMDNETLGKTIREALEDSETD